MAKGLLISGIVLFFIAILLGIYFMFILNPTAPTFDYYTIPMLVNFGLWVTSIVMIVIGAKKVRKESKAKQDEIQELKDKVKKLEDDKEKK